MVPRLEEKFPFLFDEVQHEVSQHRPQFKIFLIRGLLKRPLFFSLYSRGEKQAVPLVGRPNKTY